MQRLKQNYTHTRVLTTYKTSFRRLIVYKEKVYLRISRTETRRINKLCASLKDDTTKNDSNCRR